jgi:hypothetical protein
MVKKVLKVLRCRVFTPIPMVALIFGVSGCGADRDSYIEEVDALCATVNERFAGELSYDGGFGREHLNTMALRIGEVKDLRESVDDVEIPEDTTRPDEWITSLDDYIEDADTVLWEYGRDVTITKEHWERLGYWGWQSLLTLHEDAVDDVGTTAATFGFDSCAKVTTWYINPDNAGH